MRLINYRVNNIITVNYSRVNTKCVILILYIDNQGTKVVSNDKKQSIALARKNHHKKQMGCKNRIDTYINPETKAGLSTLKATFVEVKNEGQAIDKAVMLALESLDQTDLKQ